MPDRWFDSSRQRLIDSDKRGMEGRKSREEKFYDRYLHIRLWKDKLPDGGAMFDDGFPKSKLEEHKLAYYQKFILETRRGEWTHWISMLPAPLFFMWNEELYGWIMILYAVVANLPFIIVLRYNRLRLLRISRRRQK